MSIDSVLDRIAQLTAAPAPVQPAVQAAPASTAPTTTFASTLAQAAAPAAQPAATPAPIATATTTSATTPFGAQIDAAAAQNGVDPNLVRAVIQQESGFNPNAASAAGAQGLMQLMPGTASGLGVTNSFDPTQSIQGGTRYLKEQLDRFGGNVPLALAAYNAGPNAVAKFGGIPPYAQTQQYVRSVTAHYQAFSSQSPTSERSSL